MIATIRVGVSECNRFVQCCFGRRTRVFPPPLLFGALETSLQPKLPCASLRAFNIGTRITRDSGSMEIDRGKAGGALDGPLALLFLSSSESSDLTVSGNAFSQFEGACFISEVFIGAIGPDGDKI